MNRILSFVVLMAASLATSQTVCTGGFAGIYPCSNIDLQAHVPFQNMGGSAFTTDGNDCWGWTDPLDGKEYAIMGCTTHTAFIDITDPLNPVYKGKVNSRNNTSSVWRDMKVYNNFVFIVSEAAGHGMQVFDLKRLRNVTTAQIFTPDALYSGFGNCHNIAINEATGYAYCIGSNTFMGGPHIVNIQNPLVPVAASGYSAQGYTHDAQIVIYNGPDTEHNGKELFFGANEDKVVIVDVTNKSNPVLLSTFTYANTSYTHQGWLTPDMGQWIVGDEIDELDFGFNTRSIIVDLTDLDNPTLGGTYIGATPAIDHNGYTLNDEFYLANYRAGLRLMETDNIGNGIMEEIAFFDTFPASNSAEFNGAWSVYPYFASGNIIVSDIDRGLFILKKSQSLGVNEHSALKFVLSPNPAETSVVISAAEMIESIEIFNMLGAKVISNHGINSQSSTVDISTLSAGMYIVNINNKVRQKLLVK